MHYQTATFWKDGHDQYDRIIFTSSIDSSDIFDNLKIAKHPDYKKHLNQYKVIQINFSEMPDECESYKAYIRRVHKLLKEDLQELYPQLNLDFENATKDLLRKIHERIRR